MTLDEAIKQYEQIINIWENPNLTESQEVIEQLAAELKELQEPVEADNCERRVKEFGEKYLLVIKQLAAWLRELQGRRKEQEIATGEWVLKEHLWECNKCGCRINVANPLSGNNWNYYFCPHCGTKMIIAVQRF